MSNAQEIVDHILTGTEDSLEEARGLIFAELDQRSEELLETGREFILSSIGLNESSSSLKPKLKKIKKELEGMLDGEKYRAEDGIFGDFFRFWFPTNFVFTLNDEMEFRAYDDKTDKVYIKPTKMSGSAIADEIFKAIQKYI